MAGRGKPGHLYGERRKWYRVSGVTCLFKYASMMPNLPETIRVRNGGATSRVLTDDLAPARFKYFYGMGLYSL
jgi:hypothetical protein